LAEFYKGKTVLITGSTGFLGKILLYRFLTLLPDIKSIFLLLRQKVIKLRVFDVSRAEVL